MSAPLHDNLLSAIIDTATSGDNTIIAAVTGRKFAIFQMWLWINGTVTITLKNGAGANLIGPMACVAQNNPQWPHGDDPWFITSAGNAFIINLSGAVQVSGRVYYSIK